MFWEAGVKRPNKKRSCLGAVEQGWLKQSILLLYTVSLAPNSCSEDSGNLPC